MKRLRRKQPKINNIVKNSILKIAVFSVIVGLNWTGLSAVIETFAYYNNTENSQENIFAAGTLDFSLTSLADFLPSPILPGESAMKTINFINNDNIPKYTVNATSFVGVLCDYLDLEASLDGTNTYTGSLKNFTAGEFVFSDPDTWNFKATLQAGAPASVQGTTCNFKFVYFGSQEKNNLLFGEGFNDTEEIDNIITAGVWQKIVINKVYYDADEKHMDCGCGGCSEYNNEWVELYNITASPLDLSGWKICDNNLCDNLSGTIPAGGFAVITNKDTTWNYWEILSGVLKIVLNSRIGDGLENTADMLLLKNASSTIVDQMNWGIPTSTWPNYNENVWNPGVPDVAEGHILARVPTGFDTDLPSDWHDLGLPQVTVIWPNGGEILYVGDTYTIQWSATNPNGTDTDLTIDIYYSKDSGNTWAKITSTSTTENDGTFEWRIPLFIGSYYVPSHHARIKVVAYGPENFMVQAWDMSDHDFCPPIDYSMLTDEEKAQVEQLLADGILTETDIINRDIMNSGEATTTDDGTTTEEIATTTEETSTTTENQEGGIIDQINEAIDSVINDIVEEILPDEPTTEEVSTEETPVIDETAVIEETPTVEEPVIEEVPVIEEQPVIAPPENNSGAEVAPVDNGSGGDTGGSTTDIPSSDAGSSVDSVSVAPSE